MDASASDLLRFGGIAESIYEAQILPSPTLSLGRRDKISGSLLLGEKGWRGLAPLREKGNS